MSQVAVLVPWRGGDPTREAAWGYVRRWWAATHPGWPVITGACPDGPWSKGAAIADALARATAEVLVLADADVWCDRVDLAVDAVESGRARWAVPHRLVHRLDRQSTAAVINGQIPVEQAQVEQRPYPGYLAGGLTVIDRRLLTEAPVDPRFCGWGQEDEAAAAAWTVLAGRPWRGRADLWHLWHTPPQRLSRSVGSLASVALLARYRQATTPARMRRLLAEIGGRSNHRLERVEPVRFLSPRYPQLQVPRAKVKFRGGVAATNDPGAIAELQRAEYRALGVVPDEPATSDETTAPVDSAGQATPADTGPAAGPAHECAAVQAAQPTLDEPGGDGVPTGSAKEVLTWVGTDPGRARRAIEAENTRDKPRTTLVAVLTRIAN